MATFTYRKLGPNNDPAMGQGQMNFLADADAVAQAILTRLLLFQGEWWADLKDGLPLWQGILGTAAAGKIPRQVSLLLQQRILGTPYVTSLEAVSASYDPATRSFSFHCVVNTQFGQVSVQASPIPTTRDLTAGPSQQFTPGILQ